MSAQHSPGPWSFEVVCFDRKIPIRGGVTAYGRPYTIAHVNRPGSAYDGQDKANARLIAAAPETVSAAQQARDFIRSYFGPVSSDDPEGWSDEDARAVHDQLDAAISKALGEGQ